MTRTFSLLLLSLACSSIARADYSRTCDDRTNKGQCQEIFGPPGTEQQMCTSGTGSSGHNCSRGADIGMCRTIMVVSGQIFGWNMFYYHGTFLCSSVMPDAECSANLKETCLNGDGHTWFEPGQAP